MLFELFEIGLVRQPNACCLSFARYRHYTVCRDFTTRSFTTHKAVVCVSSNKQLLLVSYPEKGKEKTTFAMKKLQFTSLRSHFFGGLFAL